MAGVDTVVVGAGVVGLAIARAEALAGRDVLILEAAERFGTGTSARNSEVLHAGIFHAPGMLKSRLCVAGRRAAAPLLRRARDSASAVRQALGRDRRGGAGAPRDVPRRAEANGLVGRRGVGGALGGGRARARARAALRLAALSSPATAIVDSHG